MAKYVPVSKASEVAEGAMKKVTVEGTDVMLSKVKGKVYAIANRCAHAGGDLSQGKLEGTVVTCPRHGSQWDVTDGHNIRWTRVPGAVAKVAKLATFPVKVDKENILIEI
jgi:3-phenylpropionate/trans-cinnamate dioxygenase ferredoxin component